MDNNIIVILKPDKANGVAVLDRAMTKVFQVQHNRLGDQAIIYVNKTQNPYSPDIGLSGSNYMGYVSKATLKEDYTTL